MRSSTGRRLGPSREYFKKPFGSAMGHEFLVLLRLPLGGRRLPLRQHSFVIDRHDLDELRQHRLPGVEHELGLAAAGVLEVGLDHADRKSTRLNSSHLVISYAVFCLKKKKKMTALP